MSRHSIVIINLFSSINMQFTNFTEYTRIEDLKRLKFIQKHLQTIDKETITALDVGCGNGNISFQMAALGVKVLGIDISEKSISKAKKKNTFENLSFQHMAAEALEGNASFDLIVCSEVLEHLDEPEKVVHSLYRLLNPDGKLIITVPNGYGPRELLITKPTLFILKSRFWGTLFKRFKKSLGYDGKTIQSSAADLTHVQFFTKRSLHRLLQQKELELSDFQNVNFIETVFPFSWFANRIQALQKMDNKLADKLPHYFTSGFMSCWKKAEN